MEAIECTKSEFLFLYFYWGTGPLISFWGRNFELKRRKNFELFDTVLTEELLLLNLLSSIMFFFAWLNVNKADQEKLICGVSSLPSEKRVLALFGPTHFFFYIRSSWPREAAVSFNRSMTGNIFWLFLGALALSPSGRKCTTPFVQETLLRTFIPFIRLNGNLKFQYPF